MSFIARAFAVLVLVVGAAGAAQAQKAEIFSVNGAAIGGYDPVAYFTENKPVKDSPHYSAEWKGAVWHLQSAANRDAFKAAPEKYAPQYGGYCAFGASEGYAVKTEPDAWSIVGGKLYLNYNTTVRGKWSENKDDRIRRADRNWPEILKK